MILFAAQFAVAQDKKAASNCLSAIKISKQFAPMEKYGIKLANTLEIDTSACEIRTISAKSAGKDFITVKEAAAANPDALVIMNSSFYNRNTGKIMGFFIENGTKGDFAPHESLNSIFSVAKDGTPSITSATTLTAEMEKNTVSAVAGKTKWDIPPDSTCRVAVCLTAGNKVKFVMVYPLDTIAKMTEYLQKEEGCTSFVHYDGGGSAQMSLKPKNLVFGWERFPECTEPAQKSWPDKCFRHAASFLGVFPKK